MMADKNRKPSLPSVGDSSFRTRFAPTADADIYYPESDGKPMAETEVHRDAIYKALYSLIEYFKDDSDVCASGNLMMYYVKGDPRKSTSPDVFVTFGIEKKLRRIYKIWEEGKPPDFVIEFSSPKTYKRDLREKKKLYAEIGIEEYFLYDAGSNLLPEPLMGFRLVDGEYVAIEPDTDGNVYAETLGLELRLQDDGLGFFDPVSEKWLETPAEAAAHRAEQAEVRAEQAEATTEEEAKARQLVEEENTLLREEIARLRTQMESSSTNTKR
ncbi:Uma2 family endonuclease [Candidatus Poribacteria bacterium]|nr:Uma2 family endonuclease [Candidatus Poribacteria bacterium]